MRIIELIKERQVDAEAKRRQALRKRLAEDLLFFRKEKNAGLLRKRLFNMPYIREVHTMTGFTCFCDVVMTDGYEITTSAFHEADAIKKAGRQVVERLKEIDET